MREWLEQAKSKGMSLGLERVENALDKLGRPDKKMSCIHVAGSNGKGSACAQLAAGLIRAGYTVGLFSSPHVSRIEERIRMQGRPISKQDFNDSLAEVKALDVELTFFEITFLIAVLSCSKARMQIMILETGLGGRLDATNVVKNTLLNIITPIGIDHKEFLGKNITKITIR